MPRLPAKQREAEKVATRLSNGSFAAAVNDSPARFSWDEHAIKLLQNMSGDRRKRKQALETIIFALVRKREEFRKEKKTGAGSATEAIEFYQFVLEKNILWKAKAGKKSSKGAPTVSVSYDEEFLNEHNDICEVCGIGGELLCCSTCNLVFHLNCVRPSLKSVPPDSWSCAHCDATGVTGLKKDNRQRKRATTAVREMNKLMESVKTDSKKSDERQETIKTSDSKDISTDHIDEACRVCSDGGKLFACNQSTCNNKFHISCVRPAIDSTPNIDWNCAYCDVDFVTGLKPQARKRRAAISGVRAMEKLKLEFDAKRKSGNHKTSTPPKRKIEELSESSTPIHPGQPRSQRRRRQVVLQGEEESPISNSESSNIEKSIAELPTMPRFSREDIPPELIKKLGRKTTNSNSRHGQYNCKFCMDDEFSECCCFCACRICFTKHKKPDTILCDLCDGEYHIGCLSPPLSEIPSFEWYCPTCTEAITYAKENASKSGSRTSTSKKSKSKAGKSASQTAVKKGATKAKAKLALKQKKAEFSASQPRTSSGRFATKGKTISNIYASKSFSKIVKIGNPPVKRGPGRPPKSAKKHLTEQKVSSQSRKSLGKNTGHTTSTSNLKKPMFSSNGGMFPNATQQRSRSGRVVKRKAAYDEREEDLHIRRGGSAHSTNDVIEKGDSANESYQGNMSKLAPSAAAILAAQTAVSVIQKERTGGNDKVKSLQEEQSEVLSLLEANAPEPRSNSPNDGFLQQTQPSALLEAAELLPSPKSSNARRFVSPGTEIGSQPTSNSKNPRRKPGARECMQISRRFGAGIIQENYMKILMDYCSRGKVEHLIRMRERLDEHSRFLESQLAGLESLVQNKGQLTVDTDINIPDGKAEAVNSASKISKEEISRSEIKEEISPKPAPIVLLQTFDTKGSSSQAKLATQNSENE